MVTWRPGQSLQRRGPVDLVFLDQQRAFVLGSMGSKLFYPFWVLLVFWCSPPFLFFFGRVGMDLEDPRSFWRQWLAFDLAGMGGNCYHEQIHDGYYNVPRTPVIWVKSWCFIDNRDSSMGNVDVLWFSLKEMLDFRSLESVRQHQRHRTDLAVWWFCPWFFGISMGCRSSLLEAVMVIWWSFSERPRCRVVVSPCWCAWPPWATLGAPAIGLWVSK